MSYRKKTFEDTDPVVLRQFQIIVNKRDRPAGLYVQCIVHKIINNLFVGCLLTKEVRADGVMRAVTSRFRAIDAPTRRF